LSAATGIGPAELVDLDGPMYGALVRAVDERWPLEVELAAEQVELSSALVSLFARAWLRGPKIPVHTVPRPRLEDDAGAPAAEAVESPAVSVRELASLVSKPIEVVASGE
jgi:hypothetical protein